MDHPATRAATDLAYNNNPVIQAHMANVEAARAKRRQEVREAVVVPDPSHANNSADTLPAEANISAISTNAAAGSSDVNNSNRRGTRM
jgi:hypothetical protein